MTKKAQVTIFIILAIIIISVAILIFLLRNQLGLDLELTGTKDEPNPNGFMTECLRDEIKSSITVISSQGGYVNPDLKREFKFADENEFTDIAYLCYNRNYNFPCVNQEPLLMRHIQTELKNDLSEEIQFCFTKLTESLREEWEVVNVAYTPGDYIVKLSPGKASIELNAEIILTSSQETNIINGIKISTQSSLFDSVSITQKILREEAQFCTFNTLGYMMLNPEWSLSKFVTGDSTKIYKIRNRNSNEVFKFAIRGCVVPSGV